MTTRITSVLKIDLKSVPIYSFYRFGNRPKEKWFIQLNQCGSNQESQTQDSMDIVFPFAARGLRMMEGVVYSLYV